jgi:hypothetical protein
LPSLKDQQEIVGQKIIVLDPIKGNYSDFISLKQPDPNFKPVGLEFDDREKGALYVASIGKIELRNDYLMELLYLCLYNGLILILV